jgi:nitroreductase
MKYNLSEITGLIRDRRSVTPEQFSSRKVQREQVELILTNATWAPSHGLTQPWRFKVFMDDGISRLSEVLPEMYRSQVPEDQFRQAKYDRLRDRPLRASVVIAVCMERDRTKKIAEIEEVEAVACAVQNICLTSTAYGLAAFWSTPGPIYSADMNRFLGLQEQDKCLGLLYIGYPAGDWPRGHRKPLEYVTEWILA